MVSNPIQRKYCVWAALMFKVTIELIRNAYLDLCAKKHYQDALVIHIMYSLSLDPYHIFSLRYEDLIGKDQIQFWDYRTSSYKLCFLYYDLWSDIQTLKGYQEFENGECRKTKRVMIDKTILEGKFIVSFSPTNIYNRFKRRFGNTITDFNLTPNDIVKLSKFNSQNELTDQYNRSIFPKRNTSIFKPN